MQKTIFVAGGNGFIGREICRAALGAGHEVRALARSRRPAISEPWVDRVTWIRGNVLNPESWRRHLEGCDAAVHSVGIVLERPSKGQTFERINGESAIILAREAAEADLESFVMLSAKKAPPIAPQRYLTAKHQAETHIQEQFPSLRSTFLRPAFVFGPNMPATMVLARTYQAINLLPRALHFSDTMPLPVSHVAAAAVYAAVQPDIEGIVGEAEIDDLASTKAGSLRVPSPPQQTAMRSLAAATAVVGAIAWFVMRGRK